MRISILIPFVILLSCSKAPENPTEETDLNKPFTTDIFPVDEPEVKDGEFEQMEFVQPPNVDSFYNLLETKSEFEGSFVSSRLPVLFFRSGAIFSDDEMNAILLSSPTDSTYKVEVFSFVGKKWLKNDEISIGSYPIQFDIALKDFDFDGFNDIYVRLSVSNGFGILRGHLILINKDSKKMSQVKEARELGNIMPDYDSKVILTEEVIWCKENGMKSICKLSFHWEQGRLSLRKKVCPCETE